MHAESSFEMISDTNENSQVKLLNDRESHQKNAIDFISMDTKSGIDDSERLGNKGWVLLYESIAINWVEFETFRL